VITGTIIAESLRPGSGLAGIPLAVREIRRYPVRDVPDYQPGVWTAIEFGAADSAAEPLALSLAAILAEPGWYVNYSSASETFIVYRDKVFRHPRGDPAGRAEAAAYGRQHGVPEGQLDWTE
jgi:hypothetical protein